MNAKQLLMGLLVLVLSQTLKAQNLVELATINPTEFYYSSETGEKPFTVITWNDASEVTSIVFDFWGYEFELEEGVDYQIIDIDDATSVLEFLTVDEKDKKRISEKDSGFDFVFTIHFDVGNPAIFTVIPEVDITYSVIFWVSDYQGNSIDDAILTFDGVTFAPGEYFAGMYYPGEYEYSITKDGYTPASGTVTVEYAVSESVALYPNNSVAVSFLVVSNGIFIPNASIEINNTTLITNSIGIATIELGHGDYDYIISASGYLNTYGSVQIADSMVEVVVEMLSLVGTNEGNTHSTKVYPNPVNSTLNLNLVMGENTLVQIHSTSGKVVYNTVSTGSSMQIDVQQFEQGLYWVRLQKQHNVQVLKFVKN